MSNKELNPLKNNLYYFIFGNFFISVCAAVMFFHTAVIFELKIDYTFIPFIFFSTLAAYSFHWYLTYHPSASSERLKWTAQHKKLQVALFIISSLAVIYFFIQLRGYYPVILLSAFVTFMYSAPKIELKPFIMLRKIAVLKTTYLTLVWVFVTAVMPILISGAAWKYDMTLFVINRLFLIFPICVLFDYRDREEDRLEGIKNIATVITSRGLDIVFAVCVLINLSAAVFLLEEWHSLYYFACNIIPVILLVLTYRISKNTKSDLWVLRLA